MKTVLQCVKYPVLNLAAVVITLSSVAQNTGTVPELAFTKATLKSGSSNKDGAVYLFKNVATGIDATVKIVSRSSSSVVLDTIDLAPAGGNGFDKAFQPQLGIKGTAPANSSWSMKFQMDFFKAGTSTPITVDQFSVTALDIDGDGQTVAENVTMEKAMSYKLSPITNLTKPVIAALTCSKCSKTSLPLLCTTCLGLGMVTNNSNGNGTTTKACNKCDGTGFTYTLCNHPWEGSTMYVPGTSANASGIDTSASQNMVTFTYANASSIIFSYGATTGRQTSTAGLRLNSMWFKSFNMSSTMQTLPITVSNFAANLQQSQVNLSWNASMATNFSYFSVERSNDGVSYKEVAMVFAADDNSATAAYGYNDKSIGNAGNTLYYRLKMIDISGTYTYSPIRIVNIGNNSSNTIKISAFPNPATSAVTLNLPAAWQGGKAVVEIYNNAGIALQTTQYSSISQNEQVAIAQLPRGFYTINVTSGTAKAQVKVMKN